MFLQGCVIYRSGSGDGGGGGWRHSYITQIPLTHSSILSFFHSLSRLFSLICSSLPLTFFPHLLSHPSFSFVFFSPILSPFVCNTISLTIYVCHISIFSSSLFFSSCHCCLSRVFLFLLLVDFPLLCLPVFSLNANSLPNTCSQDVGRTQNLLLKWKWKFLEMLQS